jgi:hypothetical protein
MDKNLKTFSGAIKFSSVKEESWKMAENYESSSSKKIISTTFLCSN